MLFRSRLSNARLCPPYYIGDLPERHTGANTDRGHGSFGASMDVPVGGPIGFRRFSRTYLGAVRRTHRFAISAGSSGAMAHGGTRPAHTSALPDRPLGAACHANRAVADARPSTVDATAAVVFGRRAIGSGRSGSVSAGGDPAVPSPTLTATPGRVRASDWPERPPLRTAPGSPLPLRRVRCFLPRCATDHPCRG